MYEEVKKCLEENPPARERRLRSAFISDLVMRKNNILKDSVISPSMIPDIALDYANYIRYWQMVTKDNKYLRGTDWKDKQKYEELKQLELNYRPGYHKDLDIGKMLN